MPGRKRGAISGGWSPSKRRAAFQVHFWFCPTAISRRTVAKQAQGRIPSTFLVLPDSHRVGRSQSKRKGPESARAASRAEHVILCRTLMIEILAVLCWGGGSSQFSLSEKGESQYLLPPQISGIDTRTLKPSDPYCVPTVNWSLCDFVQIVKLHSPAFGYSLLFA